MPHQKNILVVEDEAVIAMDMESTLQELGHQVVVAANAKEAEPLLGAAAFDLVILDFHLQDGTSQELARHLIERQVPFIVCSGTAGLEEMGEVFKGAPFLAKPFTSDGLLSAVNAAPERQLAS